MTDEKLTSLIDERFRDSAKLGLRFCEISDLYDENKPAITRLYCSGNIPDVEPMCYITFGEGSESWKVYLNWE